MLLPYQCTIDQCFLGSAATVAYYWSCKRVVKMLTFFFLRLLELPCGKSKGKCRWQVDFGSSRFFACYLPWALALGLPHTHLGFIIFIRIFSSHANYTSWRKNFVSFIISVNLWVLCILIPWTRACFFPFIQQAKIVLDSDIIIDLISEETSSS